MTLLITLPASLWSIKCSGEQKVVVWSSEPSFGEQKSHFISPGERHRLHSLDVSIFFEINSFELNLYIRSCYFQFSIERVFIWKMYMLSCKLSVQSVDASVKVSNTNTSYFIWSLNEESLIIKLIVYTTTIQLTTPN